MSGIDFRQGVGATTMTRHEVAAFLNVSTSMVDRLIDDGQLGSWKIRRKVLIEKASVQAYYEEQRAIPPGDEALQASAREQRRARVEGLQGAPGVNASAPVGQEA